MVTLETRDTVAVEWFPLLLRLRQVQASDLGPGTSYNDSRLWWRYTSS
jgi:hypothetical protein